MNLQNTKLLVPEDVWQIIQNILIYEYGCCYISSFKSKVYHPYIYIDKDLHLTFGTNFDYFINNSNKEISYKDILKMNNTEKYIKVDLNTAKEWYNSDNETLKNLALQAYSEEELKPFDFTKIKTFEDALRALNYSGWDMQKIEDNIKSIYCYNSKASAAMLKLNIIRKALNKEYNLHLTKNTDGQNHIWYPDIKFVIQSSIYYDDKLNSSKYKKLGKITSENVTYDVIGDVAYYGGYAGLSNFDSYSGVGGSYVNVGLFGCATKAIANHFTKYFGMLIMEAMYGDMIKDIEFN